MKSDNLDTAVPSGRLSQAESGSSDIERCDREIAEIDARDPNNPENRAYLAALGRNDWLHEKRIIAGGTR